MKFIVISDTHGDHRQMQLPDGDVVIHAGDMSANGQLEEIEDFIDWFDSLPFKRKLLVAGNHDWYLDQSPDQFSLMLKATSITYLNDSGTEFDGIHVWGSPITPEFYNWAFQRKIGTEINQHWQLIPANTDVLITHGPPHGIMDEVPRDFQWDAPSSDDSDNAKFVHAGCPGLLERVQNISPAFHLFGHIHEGYGVQVRQATRFINASSMNAMYRLQNNPIVFEYGSR